MLNKIISLYEAPGLSKRVADLFSTNWPTVGLIATTFKPMIYKAT